MRMSLSKFFIDLCQSVHRQSVPSVTKPQVFQFVIFSYVDTLSVLCLVVAWRPDIRVVMTIRKDKTAFLIGLDACI